MSKELIVSVNGREKKIAIIENEKVTEFYIERGETEQGIVGNIYKGRVMRVLPGMQSAFVDVGLERDAFLYVSDFFDEEEEFERIVIDKAKKGEGADAERAAAEQIAQGRVEREHHIEATQERVEPLREAEQAGEVIDVSEAPASEAPADAGEGEAGGARRRGRRGRRRGRGQDFEEPRQSEAATRPEPEIINTPFVAADPSIQRIVDDEEAAVNGEMFKDARLQERLFDQIHAGEFNLGEDLRTAEVGSVLRADYGSSSFQRIDDSDVSSQAEERRPITPVAAHLDFFTDEAGEPLTGRASFERVSDDEEAAEARAASETVAHSSAAAEKTREKKKRGGPKTAITKASKKKPTATKKAAAPRKKAKAAADTETTAEHEDGEARVTNSRSRGEFATRRGGRRRRRPGSKPKPEGNGAIDATDGQIEAIAVLDEPALPEMVTPEPVEVAPPPAPAPAASPAPDRQQRDRRPTNGRSNRNVPRRERHQPTITDLLKEGQEILVQIAKEPIAKKGARITSHIALPGRFLVYMPTVEHVGVSRKIESDSERHRLRKLIQVILTSEEIPSGGFIVRTAGVGINESEMREDVRYLVRTWLDIRTAAEKAKPATMVHKDLDLVQRILRDQLSEDFSAIRVDSEEEYERIVEFVNRIHPRMVKRVKLYTRETPILEAFGVQTEIDKAIKPRVWLKSGGYLVINQTEALVAIDVNTGKFVGRGSGRLEDTITRTNLEAVEEIVRQIRLRDLGGIIVLDLIDMEERRNRQRVMTTLQDALRDDKSPTKVLSFNDFGLVIMTRKRVKQSLERTLCAPCQTCQGAGLLKSPQTVCYEILEDARRLARSGDLKNKQVLLRINPEVAKTLRGPERDVLNAVEDYLGPVDVTSDATIHQEQFDFAFL
ncbi:MAG: rng [Acidobacteria bacterium]|nr:rng [Acidobacteriota bacterium]